MISPVFTKTENGVHYFEQKTTGTETWKIENGVAYVKRMRTPGGERNWFPVDDSILAILENYIPLTNGD